MMPVPKLLESLYPDPGDVVPHARAVERKVRRIVWPQPFPVVMAQRCLPQLEIRAVRRDVQGESVLVIALTRGGREADVTAACLEPPKQKELLGDGPVGRDHFKLLAAFLDCQA